MSFNYHNNKKKLIIAKTKANIGYIHMESIMKKVSYVLGLKEIM